MPSDHLHERESAILKRLAAGLSDQQIADDLVLSLHTVKWYNRQIYSKLGVNSRTQAIAHAKAHGLLRENVTEAPSPLPHSPLPAQSTSFIGRERELAEVQRLLGQSRLLTLTGAGGVGKTRLALRAAEIGAASFADGVCFVDLAPLADHSMVAWAIAEALGVAEHPTESLWETLKRVLAQRRVLLLIDNFEHVIEAAPLLSTILAAAPHLQALVTSRESLRLAGEQEYPVPPLTLPPADADSAQDLAASEASALFVQRAQLAQPRFAVTDANASTIAHICIRLDGLPLAIELAAARVRVLGEEALLQRLGSRLNVLTGGARNLPKRQQTLRATIDWSYQLLEPAEQTLFGRLALFAGGWTLEAAEAVCGGEGAEGYADMRHEPATTADHWSLTTVVDGLQSLIEKSLVQQHDRRAPSGPSGQRFFMLETIHEYALERFAESGDTATVRRRHTHYFLSLAEQADSALETTHAARWLARLEAEHDNLRAALQWTLEQGEIGTVLQIVGALWRFWHIRGHLSEGRAWMERVLVADRSSAGTPEQWAKVLTGAGTLAWAQTDSVTAAQYHEQALTLYRALNDRKGMAAALNNLAAQLFEQGDTPRAYTLITECLELQRELGDETGIARSMLNLAVLVLDQGDYVRSQALSQEGVALVYVNSDRLIFANMLSNLGLAVMLQGNQQRATELFTEGLLVFRELGDIAGMAECLEGLALRYAEDEPTQFVQMFAMADRQRSSIGAPLPLYLRAAYRRYVEAAHSRLSNDVWTAKWAEGWAMTLDQAVSYALAASG